jgi:hypothetical protein
MIEESQEFWSLAIPQNQNDRIESAFEVRPTGGGTLRTATPKNHSRKNRDTVIPSHQLKENCGRGSHCNSATNLKFSGNCRKTEDLDAPLDRKEECSYKIWENFLDSEIAVSLCTDVLRFYFPRYNSASKNSHNASKKCQ